MAVSADFLDFVLDQLAPCGPIESRRMFGGVGLYAEGLFFALIAGDVLYLKTDAATRPAFEETDSQPFRPRKGAALSYWSAPIEALDDPELMVRWARRSIAAAQRAKR